MAGGLTSCNEGWCVKCCAGSPSSATDVELQAQVSNLRQHTGVEGVEPLGPEGLLATASTAKHVHHHGRPGGINGDMSPWFWSGGLKSLGILVR